MNDMMQASFDYAALPVESVDRLKTWKTEIAAFTDTVESSLVQIGMRFQKAQDELNRQGIKGDGFVAWIESETKYSCSSAYNLIGVAARFKDKPFPNFGKSVLYALAAPSTPDAIVDKAIAQAESGAKVTVADVRDWKAELETEKQRSEEQLGYSSDSAIAESQPKETHLRPLKSVPEAERKAIWDEATRKAEEEHAKLTAKRVEDAVAEWKQRSQDWHHQYLDERNQRRQYELLPRHSTTAAPIRAIAPPLAHQTAGSFTAFRCRYARCLQAGLQYLPVERSCWIGWPQHAHASACGCGNESSRLSQTRTLPQLSVNSMRRYSVPVAVLMIVAFMLVPLG